MHRLWWMGILIAPTRFCTTVASAINAFKNPGAERSEQGVKPYMPTEPALISVLRNGMLETEGSLCLSSVATICSVCALMIGEP